MDNRSLNDSGDGRVSGWTETCVSTMSLRDPLLQVTFEQTHHTGELIALFWQQDVEPPEMTWIDVRMEIAGIPGPS